jgi:hypothetical protein
MLLLGITESMTELSQPTEIPLYIIGTAHCADLSEPRSYDIPALTAAREVIASQVATWLSDSATDDQQTDSNSSGSSDNKHFKAIAITFICIASVLLIALIVLGVIVMKKFNSMSKSSSTPPDDSNPNPLQKKLLV